MERIRSTIPTSEDPIGGCIILRGMDASSSRRAWIATQLYTARTLWKISSTLPWRRPIRPASSEAEVVMLKGGMFGGYPPFTERVHICKRHLWGDDFFLLHPFTVWWDMLVPWWIIFFISNLLSMSSWNLPTFGETHLSFANVWLRLVYDCWLTGLNPQSP